MSSPQQAPGSFQNLSDLAPVLKVKNSYLQEGFCYFLLQWHFEGNEFCTRNNRSQWLVLFPSVWRRHRESDILIGVHCTHGVNRTGYLVCRYMIEKLQIPPDKAITLFNEARGHALERENYIADLKTRPRPSDPELPLSLQVTGQLGISQKQRDLREKLGNRQRRSPGNRRDRERSPHTKSQNPMQHRHGSSHKRNSGHGRREYHEDSRVSQRYHDDSRRHERHRFADNSHVSPLSRLEGPAQSSWGSGCAGWGAPAVPRGYNRHWSEGAGGERHRGTSGVQHPARSHSHPYSRQHDHRHQYGRDWSRGGPSSHWERDQSSYQGRYNNGQDVSRYVWHRGSGNSYVS